MTTARCPALSRTLPRLVAFALLALLGACSEEVPRPPSPPPAPVAPAGVRLTPVPFRALPGWGDDLQHEALPALRRSCARLSEMPPYQPVGRDGLGGVANDWMTPCAVLSRLGDSPSARDVRTALESLFQPYLVSDGERDSGLFTGYFEAELKGARLRGGRYQVPLYGRPSDLSHDPAAPPYLTRAEIEAGALGEKAPVLLWVDDAVDAHILQIQGSGRVRLEDGTVVRVGFNGSNGHKFVGLGKILLDHGKIGSGETSMQHVRAWLKTHPQESRALMADNPRYIFFRIIQGEGPVGAAGLPLTPGRSLAVDPRYIPFGVPLWLNTKLPDGRPLRRLMVAQDMGAAIKGPVRGDVFWGSGENAFDIAGKMKSPGNYFMLLPVQRGGLVAMQQPGEFP